MASLQREGTLLLRPDDFEPSDPRLEAIGVFNPGAARVGEDIVLLVRVAEGCVEKEDGYLHSPRAISAGGRPGYEIDRLKIHSYQGAKDHRKPLLEDGKRRLAFVSHLELVRITPEAPTNEPEMISRYILYLGITMKTRWANQTFKH